MHALPRRHRQGECTHRPRALGYAAAGGTLPGHARRIDLRVRAGGAQSRGHGDQVLSERVDLKATSMSATSPDMRQQTEAPTVTFLLDGREMTALPGETLIEIADREGIEIPRLCYKEGME